MERRNLPKEKSNEYYHLHRVASEMASVVKCHPERKVVGCTAALISSPLHTHTTTSSTRWQQQQRILKHKIKLRSIVTNFQESKEVISIILNCITIVDGEISRYHELNFLSYRSCLDLKSDNFILVENQILFQSLHIIF